MDYFPKAISAFNAWQDNFMTIMAANLATFGVRAEEFSPLQTLQTAWKTTYIAAASPGNRTKADVLARNEAGDAFKNAIRVFKKRFLTGNPRVSDVDVDRMGFTVPKKTHTPAPAPATAPELLVDFSKHLHHSIRFRNPVAARQGKPSGTGAGG
jgi:hypothetical protein